MMNGKVFLIPNTIAEDFGGGQFLQPYLDQIRPLRYFVVEEPKSARKLLRSLDASFPLQVCRFILCDEHTKTEQLFKNLEEIKDQDIGIISQAGLPCVADPGAEIVLWAHRRQKEVIPFLGPSSIFLALMASGLNGQSFAFNGYLPYETKERLQKIKALEARSLKDGQTQIFMETPYRSLNLFKELLNVCDPKTLLSISSSLMSPDEYIKTMTIDQWKKINPPIDKKPALFLIQKRKFE